MLDLILVGQIFCSVILAVLVILLATKNHRLEARLEEKMHAPDINESIHRLAHACRSHGLREVHLGTAAMAQLVEEIDGETFPSACGLSPYRAMDSLAPLIVETAHGTVVVKV